MSKRKQVSAEEKRTRMLDLFHEKKDFYQLKVITLILINNNRLFGLTMNQIVLFLFCKETNKNKNLFLIIGFLYHFCFYI